MLGQCNRRQDNIKYTSWGPGVFASGDWPGDDALTVAQDGLMLL